MRGVVGWQSLLEAVNGRPSWAFGTVGLTNPWEWLRTPSSRCGSVVLSVEGPSSGRQWQAELEEKWGQRLEVAAGELAELGGQGPDLFAASLSSSTFLVGFEAVGVLACLDFGEVLLVGHDALGGEDVFGLRGEGVSGEVVGGSGLRGQGKRGR